jgi:hypothetical protein
MTPGNGWRIDPSEGGREIDCGGNSIRTIQCNSIVIEYPISWREFHNVRNESLESPFATMAVGFSWNYEE